MTKTFEIKTGIPDSDGEMIMPGALKIKGESIPLIKDSVFHVDNWTGSCTVRHTDDAVLVDIESNLPMDNLTVYPCFMIMKSEMKNDVRIIHEARLLHMGISPTPTFKES